MLEITQQVTVETWPEELTLTSWPLQLPFTKTVPKALCLLVFKFHSFIQRLCGLVGENCGARWPDWHFSHFLAT